MKKKIKYRKKEYNFDTMFPQHAIKPCRVCNGNMIKREIAGEKGWKCTRCGNGEQIH